jgi:DNA-binding CsgD family transcriptional regulator
MDYTLELDDLRGRLPFIRKRLDRVKALNRICMLSYRKDPKETLSMSSTAYELAIQIDNKKAIADSLVQIASSCHALGKYSYAQECLQSALSEYNTIGDTKGVSYANHKLSGILLEIGEYERSLVLSKESVTKITSETPNSLNALSVQAGSHLRLCHYADSVECLHDIISIASHKKKTLNEAIALEDLANIYLLIGDNQKADTFAIMSKKQFLTTEDPAGIASSYYLLGKIDEAKGNLQAAHKFFSDANDIYEHMGEKKGAALATLSLASVHAKRGHTEVAMKQSHRSLEIFQEIAHREHIIAAQMQIGEILTIDKKYDEALGFLKEANLNASRIEHQRLHSLSFLKLAEVYEAKKEESLALRYFKKYMDFSSRLASPSELRKVIEIENETRFKKNVAESLEQDIKTIGHRFPVLTKSETKVCMLIKEGQSSKEIAEILNMSLRTVESHRYHIRKKIGFVKDSNLHAFLNNL